MGRRQEEGTRRKLAMAAGAREFRHSFGRDCVIARGGREAAVHCFLWLIVDVQNEQEKGCQVLLSPVEKASGNGSWVTRKDAYRDTRRNNTGCGPS